MPGALSMIALDIVVLPAPDGEDKTYFYFRLWFVRSLSTSLLHVLSLFSNLSNSRLQGQADFRQRVGCRFRALGIRFPIEFLTEKVESAANGLRRHQQLSHRFTMGSYSVDFFPDISFRS